MSRRGSIAFQNGSVDVRHVAGYKSQLRLVFTIKNKLSCIELLEYNFGLCLLIRGAKDDLTGGLVDTAPGGNPPNATRVRRAQQSRHGNSPRPIAVFGILFVLPG